MINRKKLILSLLFYFITQNIYFSNISEARPGGGSSFRSTRSYSSSSSSYKSKSYSSSSSSYKKSNYSYTPSYKGTKTTSTNTYSDNSSTPTYQEATWDELLIGFGIFFLIIIAFIYINFLIIRGIYRAAKKAFFSNHNSTYDDFKNINNMEEMSNISSDEIDFLVESIKLKDENFSRILFLDFVNSLYHKFYMGYGDKKELNNLKAFINTEELEKQSTGKGKVSSVIVGSIDIIDIVQTNDKDLITVEIDANYTLDNVGYQIKYLILEKWCFVRDSAVLSKEPEQMKNLSCPSCGGANNFTDAGLCSYCGSEIVLGKMQWALKTKRTILHEQFLENESLGSDVQEEGTTLPTIKQKKLSDNISKFKEKNNIDPSYNYIENFKEKHVDPFFFNLYNRWSNNNLSALRPFISDRLYESFDFWLKNYAKKDQNNRVEGIKISKIDIVKIELDKFYESITVRIFAECFDYTESKGKVVAGSKTKLRKFTEYWTFIRKNGTEVDKIDQFDMNSCPSCAAPIEKNALSAKCAYCGSITNDGDFSWTLAVITQDENYK
ncbi:MAG: TIM44-like domain-containing protein [Cyanobacteriota bacterium]